ncbi:DUF2306 domain-containing protein [Paenibacillus sp. N3.4]|uniref:DUF2306 domain-containing protein n=1 Tax=Paenibacillus sp. N3.4 TaxID=2603222 RepID=UPI0011C8669C|nr:DUF2306 domain-containing protein [Paenibacillus sp. N3.4]TXK84457.1 DUF2306 domain-containing protein [Paenibacillus sp. N3.4]
MKKKILFSLLYVLVFVFTLYVVVQYVVFRPEQAGLVSLKLKDVKFPFDTWKIFFYVHIILGMLALILGAFQLTARSRKPTKLHRRIGNIYASSIFINILAVPFLSMYATGGISSGVAFLVLDLVWLTTTVLGVFHIVRRNVVKHREWMLRSYSITCVFITFRFVVALIAMLFHVSNSVAFPCGIFIATLINLLISEASIRNKRKQTNISTIERIGSYV